MTMNIQTMPLVAPNDEAEVKSSWIGCEGEPIVSILCATYQHEKYIDDAICGFLSQKTTFPFEIIIRDDASTDLTAVIANYYYKKFPSLIKLVVERENQYPDVNPTQVLTSFAKGKYIAFCEGDDYWTDKLKLQKQVDLMELRPNVVLIYHSFINIIVRSSGVDVNRVGEPVNQLRNGPSTCTRMIRNSVVKHYPIKLYSSPNGDKAQKFFLEEHGEICFMPDVYPSVRRMHPGGVVSAVGELERLKRRYETWVCISEFYEESPRAKAANIKKKLSFISLLREEAKHENILYCKIKIWIKIFRVRILGLY